MEELSLQDASALVLGMPASLERMLGQAQQNLIVNDRTLDPEERALRAGLLCTANQMHSLGRTEDALRWLAMSVVDDLVEIAGIAEVHLHRRELMRSGRPYLEHTEKAALPE